LNLRKTNIKQIDSMLNKKFKVGLNVPKIVPSKYKNVWIVHYHDLIVSWKKRCLTWWMRKKDWMKHIIFIWSYVRQILIECI